MTITVERLEVFHMQLSRVEKDMLIYLLKEGLKKTDSPVAAEIVAAFYDVTRENG